jgi:hypothetical protein
MLEKEAGMSAGTQLEYELLKCKIETLWVIFETLPMGVVVADLDGRLLANPAAQKILAPHTAASTTPEKTIVFGWYLSDQVTPLPPERFPCFAPARENVSAISFSSSATRAGRKASGFR